MKKLWFGIFSLSLVSPCFSQSLGIQYEYRSDSNTVLLLHMDETSGSIVGDASSYANNGVAKGTTIVNGKFGTGENLARTLI